MLFEELGEVLHVQNAAVLGDGLDLQGGAVQQLGGQAHPLLVDMVGEGLPGFPVEKPAGGDGSGRIQR